MSIQKRIKRPGQNSRLAHCLTTVLTLTSDYPAMDCECRDVLNCEVFSGNAVNNIFVK